MVKVLDFLQPRDDGYAKCLHAGWKSCIALGAGTDDKAVYMTESRRAVYRIARPPRVSCLYYSVHTISYWICYTIHAFPFKKMMMRLSTPLHFILIAATFTIIIFILLHQKISSAGLESISRFKDASPVRPLPPHTPKFQYE
jgi:hypothetical protein